MTSLRRILLSGAVLMAASGFALANDIELFQTASGGTLSPVTAPPGVASPDTTVSGFSQSGANAAATAWVSSNCPVNDVCTLNSVTFNKVEVGYSIDLTQSFTLLNSNNNTVLMPCIAGSCGGSLANDGNGIAIQGTTQLQIDDGLYGTYNAGPPVSNPSAGDIVNATNLPTDNVATNTASGCNAGNTGCTYWYSLAPGSTAFSSAAPYVLNAGYSTVYSSSDSNWISGFNESGYYSQASVPFEVAVLSGAITDTQETGVTTSSNNANLNSGNINVEYGYDVNFTEYNPNVAPEPGTMLLFGGALIGLSLIGKKGFRKS